MDHHSLFSDDSTNNNNNNNNNDGGNRSPPHENELNAPERPSSGLYDWREAANRPIEEWS